MNEVPDQSQYIKLYFLLEPFQQSFSLSKTSDAPQARIESAQYISYGSVEWSFSAVFIMKCANL